MLEARTPDKLMSTDEYYRLRDKAKEFLTQENSSKAIEYYSRAIKEGLKLSQRSTFSPKLIPTEERARCMSQSGHNNRTCETCSKYLELPICYANRSLAYFNLKKYEFATTDAEKAIMEAPEWSKVNFLLMF